MNKPHTLAELKTELTKTEEKLRAYNEIILERNRLAELIRAWETAFPTEADGSRKQSQAAIEAPQSPESTDSFAHRALREFGAMTTGTLLISVRQKGWKGSGDDAKDRDRLYQVMKRRPEKFARLPKGKWKAIEP
jgi:hypothetical protein